MRDFPQFTFKNFFLQRYYEGGLCYSQIQELFEFCTKEKYNEYRFFAGIQGIDLDKHTGSTTESQSSRLDEQQKKQDIPLFRDPSEYNSLSKEEKEELTAKMKSKHKQWIHSKSGVIRN